MIFDLKKTLKQVQTPSFLMTFLAIMFLVCPGTLVLLVVDKGLFISLDTWKVALLSTSFCLPLIMANMGIMSNQAFEDKYGEELFRTMVVSIMCGGVALLVIALIKFEEDISLGWMIFLAVAVDLFLVVSTKYFFHREEKRDQKRK